MHDPHRNQGSIAGATIIEGYGTSFDIRKIAVDK